MPERPPRHEFEYSIATSQPTLRQRRLAIAVIVGTLAAYTVAAPFATIPLPRIDSFIPTMLAIIFVTDLITAVLLFGLFSATGSRALLVLASAYLFSSLLVVAHALTFPGAFAPAGLLGAGPQTSAWLNVLWRLGLAMGMAGYALLRSRRQADDSIELSAPRAISWSVASVVVVVSALTWTATAGHDLLPRVLDSKILPLGYYLNGLIALTHLLALLLLLRTREKSVLDLWLMVAAFALFAEGALVTFFLTARFSVGFYAIRLISLPVAKVVLIALLSETVKLHARLLIANRNLQRERATRLLNAQVVVAAIAHEVGQPLAAIRSFVHAGKRVLDGVPPDVVTTKKFLDQMDEATGLAYDVFKSFSSLFAEDAPKRELVDMNTFTLEVIRLLRKELDDHNVTTVTELELDLPLVPVHPEQLREVIRNLVQNSIEAMTATTNRRIISLATSRHGSHSISISLQDTGPGIDPGRIENIFTPFVTTKVKGTGLGLAICKMIVEQHGGGLTVAQAVSGGARFDISLPTQ